MKSDKSPEKVKVAERREYKLCKPHTHQGKDYVSGDKIMLTAAQAVFLRDKLAAEKPAAATPAAAEQEG